MLFQLSLPRFNMRVWLKRHHRKNHGALVLQGLTQLMSPFLFLSVSHVSARLSSALLPVFGLYLAADVAPAVVQPCSSEVILCRCNVSDQ